MIVEEVEYNGVIYNVHNPGTLIRANKKYFADQLLDGTTSMSYKKQGTTGYLRVKYGITQEDYYIIVVLKGDKSKIHKCELKTCDNKTEFIDLYKGYRKFCCLSHKDAHKFLTGDETGRWTKEMRSDRARKSALNQVKNGTLNLLDGEISRRTQRRLVEQGLHHWQGEIGSRTATERLLRMSAEGTNPFLSNKVSIKSARIHFINAGNPGDTCYLYLATPTGRPDLIKIGASRTPDRRLNFRGKKCYDNIEIIRESTRLEIADIEYAIKMKFYDKVVIGTETYEASLKGELLEFVNSIVNNKVNLNDYLERE